MNTQAVAAGIAARVATITTVRGASATPSDAVPASPWAVVGNHHGTLEAGSFERVTYIFPLRIYVERTADDARTGAIVNGLVDELVAAFRSGITLGAVVAQTRVTDWDTGTYVETDEAAYQCLDANIEVLVASGQSYTA